MKKLEVIGVVVVILGIIAGLWIFFRRGNADSKPTGESEGDVSHEVSQQPSTMEEIRKNFPKGETLALGTSSGAVTVKNFYNDAVSVNEEYIIVRKNALYEITYSTYDSSFGIGLFEASNATRVAAEKDFLTTLGITQNEACRLNVTEGVPYSADPAPADQSGGQAGKSYHLSFCPGRL